MEFKDKLTKLIDERIRKVIEGEEFVDKLANSLAIKLTTKLKPEIIFLIKEAIKQQF